MADTLEIIDVNTWYGPSPLSADQPTMAKFQAALAGEGVAGALTSHSMAVMLDHRKGNRLTLEQLATHPNMTPVAVVPYTQCLGPEDVAEVAEAGFKVLRIGGTREWPLDNVVIAGMIAEAAKANLLVMLELGIRGSMSQLVRAIGDADLDVICLNATYAIHSEIVWLLREHPRLHIDMSKMAVSGGLEELVERFGPSQIVYGSGWPANEMRPHTLMLRNAEIDDEARRAIAAGNIRRLLDR